MSAKQRQTERYQSQLRLLLEELCCDLCLFEHGGSDFSASHVQIEREFYLGTPGAFADIRVSLPEQAPFFVEIKYGYSLEKLQSHLRRKYGQPTPAVGAASKLVLVVDADNDNAANTLLANLAGCVHPGLELQVWPEARLLAMIEQQFHVEVKSISENNLLNVRETIDRAKGFYAFGGTSLADYQNDPLRAELLWHFDFWRLRQLREAHGFTPPQVLPPGTYRGVIVVLCDLCSFSSYVRDTPEDELTRHCLTSFYSKGRYEIIKKGGMLYQIIGDSVVGLFGVPERHPDCVRDALRAASGLVSISTSVSHHWQRNIDHLQPASGGRVGVAIGDIQIVSCRPFSRTNIGVIGDPINLAARLQAAAQPNEVVISNSLYNQLDLEAQEGFAEMAPVEAHNLGRIKAWKLNAACGTTGAEPALLNGRAELPRRPDIL